MIIRVSLGLTIGLLPLIYFTRLPEWWEWPKAFILYAGVTVALVSWLLWSLINRRFMARFGLFEITLAGLLLMGGLSTIFSDQRYVSLVGMTGTQADTFVTLFFLVVLAWLFKATTPPAARRWYLYIWLGSFGLVVLGTLLQIGGLPVWPGADLGKTFQPTGNSVTILGLLTSVIWLTAWQTRRTVGATVFKLTLDLLMAACLVLFVYLDRPYASLLLMAGAIVLTVFGLSERATNRSVRARRWLDWRLAVAFVIALIILFINVEGLTKIGPGTETSLPSSTSAQITWTSFKHQPVLGSGPATFYYDFVRYRPASFNVSVLSQLRFVKASNAWWQLAATWGPAGLLLFVWLLGLGISRAFNQSTLRTQLSRSAAEPFDWLLLWLSLSLFLTAGNLVLIVWLWASLGLATASKKSMVEPAGLPRSNWLVTPVAALILLGVIGGWYGLGRVWAAPLYAHQASQAASATRPLTQVRSLIEQAIKLDPWQAGYRLRLAEVDVVNAQLLAQESKADQEKIIAAAQSGVEAGKVAERLDPLNPAVLESSIQFYQGLQGIVSGIYQAIPDFYRRIAELEPNSATAYVEWGKAELLAAQADLNSDDESTKARAANLIKTALTHFNQALELKPDDIDALYHQALGYELQGDRAQAKDQMKALAQAYPNEPEILFELGRQERLDNNLDEALRLLTQARELASQSVAVHLELANIYEAQNNFESALEELKLIQKSEPDNEQLKQRIANLEAKK
ncbi:MAG: Tetratricopeptide TPR_2 repeat protein [Candidatus Giovannonibacteria bacterium GW2011_GWA2_53_7]|uniref:Tetratricopeptide TPR_2 repeat protein n=1 Tax=Candidatus Giovannonibacteria bacterium GW2011_GWA2_53_7 TaxID=1618650 RepID=A0A0G1XWN3_9BACT|nr:MAG: Tetratricopeptide TPR_2 repeat protein [Candidatus Giovannonibacteria bacterium GW2011_GWA2_53_7]